MSYQDFIEGINNGTIQKATFSVTNYAHYRNCTIYSKILTSLSGAYVGRIIWICLTSDNSEKKGFLDCFNEKEKLFYIKNKGSFTLKQMWPHITITSIE